MGRAWISQDEPENGGHLLGARVGDLLHVQWPPNDCRNAGSPWKDVGHQRKRDAEDRLPLPLEPPHAWKVVRYLLVRVALVEAEHGHERAAVLHRQPHKALRKADECKPMSSGYTALQRKRKAGPTYGACVVSSMQRE